MVHSPGTATYTAIGMPELLEMMLSNLPPKTLTHALRVSKHWQATILASIHLRRVFFLYPEPAKIHLEWKKGLDPKWYYPDQRVWLPAIVFEPNQASKAIVRAHPALALEMDSNIMTYLSSRIGEYATYKAVSPSTLVFQPPLTRVLLWHKRFGIAVERQEGVTFGAIVEEFDKLEDLYNAAVEASSKVQNLVGNANMPFDVTAWLEMKPNVPIRCGEILPEEPGYPSSPKKKLKITANGAVEANSDFVKQAQYASLLEKSGVTYADDTKVQERKLQIKHVALRHYKTRGRARKLRELRGDITPD